MYLENCVCIDQDVVVSGFQEMVHMVCVFYRKWCGRTGQSSKKGRGYRGANAKRVSGGGGALWHRLLTLLPFLLEEGEVRIYDCFNTERA